MFGTTTWRIPIGEIEKYDKKSRKQTQKNIFPKKFLSVI
jgi:hypothetical protein